MPIGKLESVPLRELWKHEERGFSAWLEQNIDALAEELGITLTVLERERTAGSFQVDLVAEDANGNLVVIENQLEPTDHDHLGKVLTYLTNLEAHTAIWITSVARAEHIRAVSWLNEATGEDIAFYLVRLAAYRIGDSDPAPQFTAVVAPSADTKAIGQQKEKLAERHVLRREFWKQLLDRSKATGVTLFSGVSPLKDSWLSTGAGKSGLTYVYCVWLEDKTSVELYIDVGDQAENKRVFDSLLAKRESIESQFGGPLEWARLDDKRASRIRAFVNKGGLKDEGHWPAIQGAMIDAMDRLSKAMRPHIHALRS